MGTIRLLVQRFDPRTDDTPHEQEYAFEEEGAISVIQAIRRVHHDIDPTLAYRNTDCRRGVCGLCSMMVNGRRRLACMVAAEGTMTIAAPPNRKVVRDLVFDLDP